MNAQTGISFLAGRRGPILRELILSLVSLFQQKSIANAQTPHRSKAKEGNKLT